MQQRCLCFSNSRCFSYFTLLHWVVYVFIFQPFYSFKHSQKSHKSLKILMNFLFFSFTFWFFKQNFWWYIVKMSNHILYKNGNIFERLNSLPQNHESINFILIRSCENLTMKTHLLYDNRFYSHKPWYSNITNCLQKTTAMSQKCKIARKSFWLSPSWRLLWTVPKKFSKDCCSFVLHYLRLAIDFCFVF